MFSAKTGKLFGLLIYSFTDHAGMMEGVTHPVTSWRALKKMLATIPPIYGLAPARLVLAFKRFNYFYPTSPNLASLLSSQNPLVTIESGTVLRGAWSDESQLGLSPLDGVVRMVPLNGEGQEISERAVAIGGSGAPFIPYDFIFGLFDPGETIRVYVNPADYFQDWGVDNYTIGALPETQMTIQMDEMPFEIDRMFSGSLLSQTSTSAPIFNIQPSISSDELTINVRKVKGHEDRRGSKAPHPKKMPASSGPQPRRPSHSSVSQPRRSQKRSSSRYPKPSVFF